MHNQIFSIKAHTCFFKIKATSEKILKETDLSGISSCLYISSISCCSSVKVE